MADALTGIPPAPRLLTAKSLKRLRRFTGHYPRLALFQIVVGGGALIMAIVLADQGSPAWSFSMVIGAANVVLGVLIAFGSAVRFSRKCQICEQGVVAAGSVITAKRWPNFMQKKGLVAYSLRYRFIDDRGREHVSKQRTWPLPEPFALNQGDAVTVLFDRVEPARSLVPEFVGIEFLQGRDLSYGR